MSEPRKLSIVIPCYNEQLYVYEVLRRACHVDLDEPNMQREVLIVDDGSSDGSVEQIEAFIAEHPSAPVKLLRHERNRGKGAAIRSALAQATGDFLIVQDADLEYSIEDYPKLLRPLLEGKPVVYGTRHSGRIWRTHISGTIFALGGALENIFFRLLYPRGPTMTDIATCYKCFRMDVIKSLPLRCEGFEFCPEVSAMLANRKLPIHEVLVSYTPRKVWQGKKIRTRDFFIAIATLWRVRTRRL
ncbi:MAG: glycosyltransferase family 2 protein [Candidatus Alcyoniella australis]|nr:glycosyltransferase family 2 protein [Candidatus Alcyoniella australis]